MVFFILENFQKCPEGSRLGLGDVWVFGRERGIKQNQGETRGVSKG